MVGWFIFRFGYVGDVAWSTIPLKSWRFVTSLQLWHICCWRFVSLSAADGCQHWSWAIDSLGGTWHHYIVAVTIARSRSLTLAQLYYIYWSVRFIVHENCGHQLSQPWFCNVLTSRTRQHGTTVQAHSMRFSRMVRSLYALGMDKIATRQSLYLPCVSRRAVPACSRLKWFLMLAHH